jgi:hypothetical protein
MTVRPEAADSRVRRRVFVGVKAGWLTCADPGVDALAVACAVRRGRRQGLTV